jgi:cell division protein FtsN
MILGNDGALKGRLITIVILTAVSGGSFTLGYFVGRTTASPEGGGRVIEAYEKSVETGQEPATAKGSQEAVAEEPSILKSNLDVAPKGRQASREELKVKKRSPKKQAQRTYSVQAGVFKEKTYAESFALKLKKRGYGAFLQSSGNVYVVKVGKFKNKADADALALTLKEAEGIEGFVVIGPG